MIRNPNITPKFTAPNPNRREGNRAYDDVIVNAHPDETYAAELVILFGGVSRVYLDGGSFMYMFCGAISKPGVS